MLNSALMAALLVGCIYSTAQALYWAWLMSRALCDGFRSAPYVAKRGGVWAVLAVIGWAAVAVSL